MIAQPSAQSIQRTYLLLQLCTTLAASLIWGIDTLFLLSAGLSNTQVFLVNASFMVGQVLFEVPTGLIADMRGRRSSYLLGTVSLAVSTLLYVVAWYFKLPVWFWAGSTMFLGLGFAFFSGATQAWLVDALHHTKFKGQLDAVFGRGQTISGVAMLVGAVGGGWLAQTFSFAVPYILRATLLLLTFGVAWVWMRDWGFTPKKGINVVSDFKELITTSWQFSTSHSAVGWMMVAGPFTSGVSFYAFYAMQPYLLQLYQNDQAYSVAGLGAALVAGAQIVGGLVVPQLQKLFDRRTTLLIVGSAVAAVIMFLLGTITQFWLAIVLLAGWGLIGAALQPVRQSYLNGLIPSAQRATILSFDAMVSSVGGVVTQPFLGRIADVAGYAQSFRWGGGISALSLPWLVLARRLKPSADDLRNKS